METTSLTPETKNEMTTPCGKNSLKWEATHKHKHIDAYFQLLKVCENGSWKGLNRREQKTQKLLSPEWLQRPMAANKLR